jgi:glycerol-3-phosphate acyltransferase PlsY
VIPLSLTIGLPAAAYLVGSIPFGLVLTRWFTDIDIRAQGSGNIGATNVRRLAGNTLGAITLAGDVLKGSVPVAVASALSDGGTAGHTFVAAVALAAFLGHLYPLYLGFRGGGKGVATAGGCAAVISPIALAIALAVFLLTLWRSNHVSAGSLAAAAALPAAMWPAAHSPVFAGCFLIIAVLIFIRHKTNIQRLLSGTEASFRKARKR